MVVIMASSQDEAVPHKPVSAPGRRGSVIVKLRIPRHLRLTPPQSHPPSNHVTCSTGPPAKKAVCQMDSPLSNSSSDMNAADELGHLDVANSVAVVGSRGWKRPASVYAPGAPPPKRSCLCHTSKVSSDGKVSLSGEYSPGLVRHVSFKGEDDVVFLPQDHKSKVAELNWGSRRRRPSHDDSDDDSDDSDDSPPAASHAADYHFVVESDASADNHVKEELSADCAKGHLPVSTRDHIVDDELDAYGEDLYAEIDAALEGSADESNELQADSPSAAAMTEAVAEDFNSHLPSVESD